MDFTAFVETVFTVPVLLTALIVGGVQEVVKQVIVYWKDTVKSHPMFRTFMGIAPLPFGMVLGWYIIPEGGVAPPEVMGLLAGAFSSKAYDAIAPYLKHVTRKEPRKEPRKESSDE